ncbi:MAG TPA: 2-dehydro-3-deoxyphosphogluconate aldolase [Candidatus Dormibacteraeota bacterium]|nr:2-dehydro-3-deoxyphosphogluconate aldolase [Candidatus Dormibacteraeota bacterium]
MLTREQAFPNRVAGVIRSDDPEAAFRACVAALEGGIGTIEVTMTVPSCLDIVRGLVASTGGALPVGVGTVWQPGVVTDAVRAGAAFVVTPGVVPEVAEACRREDVLCVLGALTPTEVHLARRAGADLVKVFPVQAAGGPDYIRWLRGPLPDAPLWVSGGVEIDQIEEYLSLGVSAIGLTTALFPADAVRRGDASLITGLARRAAAAAGAIWA